jgi:hypothetical protein
MFKDVTKLKYNKCSIMCFKDTIQSYDLRKDHKDVV